MKLLSALLVGLSYATPALPREAALQVDLQPKIAVRVDLVALDVEVLDPQGEPVTGLRREEFTVREDGVQREISSFAWVSNQSVSLTAVLDSSSVSSVDLSIAKQSIALLAHLLAHEDEVCLYSYDYRDAYLELDFSTDRPLLVQTLENIGVPSQNKRGFLKGLFGNPPRAGLGLDLALLNVPRGRNQRKAVLLISNRLQGLGQGTLDHVLELGASVFLLSVAGAGDDRDTAARDAGRRREFARKSGGREFAMIAAGMPRICRAIAFALKNHYTITYTTETGAPGRLPRRIEVSVPGKGYTTYARRSYAIAP